MIALIAVASAVAQGVGSSRGLPGGEGRHMIKGRVFTPTGRPAEAGIKVRLEGQGDAAGSKTTATDLDGAFLFSNVTPGSYAVIVDQSPDYDMAREPVQITPGYGTYAASQTMNVTVNLKARGAAAAFAKIPKDARDAYTKGMEAASKGESKTAIEMFEKAVSIYPTFSQALGELGLLFMRSGKMDKAAKTYEALLAITPNDATAHLNLGIALYNVATTQINDRKLDEAKDTLTKAELQLRQALKMNSTSPTGHYYLGLILIKAKRYDEAQKEMETAIANGGQDIALAHKYLGGLYINSNRNKDAADQLEKYLELDPKAPDAERIRGTIKDLRSKQ
ncbi:MAG TPA: tetratricopeptide repeat protein [Pyrinomonadaceae bacterium]|jgi:tetratricopeptide (TPR) repeat protein